jgi:pyruvate/2-oxoglutarate dehydrogenase complex dihydrolipoamide dehydrogenase (E3) component
LLLSPFLKKKIDQQAIPRVTYTDPEIASIGLSEEEAFETYGQKKIAVYLVPMSEVDRAITQGRTEGFVKIVTKRWSSHILGATIICPRAGEMLSEISLAMFAKIPLRKLAGLIHPYPTYSLAIRRAADKWLSQTILSFIRTLWKK